jgi:hypothetical protein
MIVALSAVWRAPLLVSALFETHVCALLLKRECLFLLSLHTHTHIYTHTHIHTHTHTHTHTNATSSLQVCLGYLGTDDVGDGGIDGGGKFFSRADGTRWVRTGDMATTDGEGRFMLTGRIGNQVITISLSHSLSFTQALVRTRVLSLNSLIARSLVQLRMYSLNHFHTRTYSRTHVLMHAHCGAHFHNNNTIRSSCVGFA